MGELRVTSTSFDYGTATSRHVDRFVPLDYGTLTILGETKIEREVRARSADKERETVAWIEQIPAGAILYDIGANIGAYTLIAASRGISVAAFEPDPFNVTHLHRNLARNQLHATVFPYALGREPGLAGISNTQEAGRTHTLGKVLTYDPLVVSVVALDELVKLLGLPCPDFMKIDVDGFEVEVLAGASEVIGRGPSILVETVDGTQDAVHDLLSPTHRREAAYPHASGVRNEVWVKR